MSEEGNVGGPDSRCTTCVCVVDLHVPQEQWSRVSSVPITATTVFRNGDVTSARARACDLDEARKFVANILEHCFS